MKRITKFFIVFVGFFLRSPALRKKIISFLGKDNGSKIYVWYKKITKQVEVREEITYLTPSGYNVYKKIIETIDQGKIKK